MKCARLTTLMTTISPPVASTNQFKWKRSESLTLAIECKEEYCVNLHLEFCPANDRCMSSLFMRLALSYRYLSFRFNGDTSTKEVRMRFQKLHEIVDSPFTKDFNAHNVCEMREKISNLPIADISHRP